MRPSVLFCRAHKTGLSHAIEEKTRLNDLRAYIQCIVLRVGYIHLGVNCSYVWMQKGPDENKVISGVPFAEGGHTINARCLGVIIKSFNFMLTPPSLRSKQRRVMCEVPPRRKIRDKGTPH